MDSETSGAIYFKSDVDLEILDSLFLVKDMIFYIILKIMLGKCC